MPSYSFNEQADYEKGFSQYFAQHIAPRLDTLELERRSKLSRFYLASAIGGGVFCFAFFMLFYAAQLLHNPALGLNIDAIARGFSKHGGSVGEGKLDILFIIGALACIWPGMISRSYANDAKTALLPDLLKFFGNITYFPNNQIPPGRLADFGILPTYNSYTSDDHIAGALDNVNFSLAEFKLEERQGKNTRVTFRGIAIVLQMNKPFEGKTILQNHMCSWAQHLQGKFTGMQDVQLEDVTFNKQFSIFSTNQVEARYILTPMFMEQVMKLAALMHNWGGNPSAAMATPGHNLAASFYSDSLLLMVGCNRDMFKPGSLFSSAYDVDELRSVLYQIYLIRAIIQTLKLSEKKGAYAGQPVAQMQPEAQEATEGFAYPDPIGSMPAQNGAASMAGPWSPAATVAAVAPVAATAPAPSPAQPAVHQNPPADEW